MQNNSTKTAALNLHSQDAKFDSPARAVGAILVAVFALSLGDALIKQMSTGFVLWQVFVIRSALAIPFLLSAIRLRSASTSFLPKVPVWTLLRSLMLVAMWLAYYAALPHLQLSVAAAAYYTLPLFITLFSPLLAGEKVRLIGWIAVLIGFVGVLLVLRPDESDFNYYALLPLLSAILYALAMIMTRTKCREEDPLVLSAILNFCFIVAGIVGTLIVSNTESQYYTLFLKADWTPMGLTEWIAMAILAISILFGSIGAAVAYQSGRPATVGTFDFAYVGFAVIWGFLFFAEVPDGMTLVGMAMIVAAGILSLRR
ncbi:MAG: DMT family transporter [Rhodospirillales bacterium]